MIFSKEETEKFMREALAESQKALPACLPNPPVGCVLVKNGAIVSRGFTQAPGKYHAEAMALKEYVGAMEEVAAFVTLEPCSFHGRTPSCAKALVEAGIHEVYVALIDSHPKNQGRGIEILKEGGVVVHTGVLEAEVSSFLSSYLIMEKV